MYPLRKERHRTIQRAEREGLFSSILVCADCGSRMHFCTCKSFDGNEVRRVVIYQLALELEWHMP